MAETSWFVLTATYSLTAKRAKSTTLEMVLCLLDYSDTSRITTGEHFPCIRTFFLPLDHTISPRSSFHHKSIQAMFWAKVVPCCFGSRSSKAYASGCKRQLRQGRPSGNSGTHHGKADDVIINVLLYPRITL
jgi:hypothetical protein